MAKLKSFKVEESDLTSSMLGQKQFSAPISQNTNTNTGYDTESVADTPKRATSGKNKGLPIGEERYSFILLSEQYEKLQAMAYWERQTMKDTVIEIFRKAIDEYEARNGTLRPKPKKR